MSLPVMLPLLQKAQRKMLDVINSVGLGEAVLKMIERRHKSDLYLAFGGMVSGAARLAGSCINCKHRALFGSAGPALRFV